MAIITTGQAFTVTGPVTNTKLQDIASKATFNDPVDETSLELIPLGTNAGKLGIKDAGVTAAKLATDALELVQNLAYPVGSIYMNATVATNPGTLLGNNLSIAGVEAAGLYGRRHCAQPGEPVCLRSSRDEVPGRCNRRKIVHGPSVLRKKI